MASKPGEFVWERYFTTTTAEYFGTTRGGNKVLVVAHGVGPMATVQGILSAYSHEYKDKTRHNRGGRISQKEFWDLESGQYGEVSVIPVDELLKQYEYPFHTRLRAKEALDNPLLRARLGAKAEEFVDQYAAYAKDWHQAEYEVEPENRYGLPDHERFLLHRRKTHLMDRWNPYILFCEAASNCPYGYVRDGVFKLLAEDDEVIAHLISTSGLQNMSHDGHQSLVTDIQCYEWLDGVRLVGMPRGSSLSLLREGPESSAALVKKCWRELLEPVQKPINPGMRKLTKVGQTYFTEYLKRGASMDLGEPEFEVVGMEKIGRPVTFCTEIGGYEGFLRYSMSEVRAIAPPKANAYTVVGEIETLWEGGNPKTHRTSIQFYCVKVDTTARVRRADDLAKDFGKVMELVK